MKENQKEKNLLKKEEEILIKILKEKQLPVDPEGFILLEDILEQLHKQESELTESMLNAMIEKDHGTHFITNVDKTMVRLVELEHVSVPKIREAVPPDLLYHGTSEDCLGGIEREGIRAIYRNFVYLSTNKKAAYRIGEKHGVPKVLSVNSGAMYREGYKFWLSETGIWMTEHVPGRYITNVR